MSFIGETRFVRGKQSSLHRLCLFFSFLLLVLFLFHHLLLQLFLVFYPLPSPCRFCFFYVSNLILIHSFFLFFIFLHILFYFFLFTLLILLVFFDIVPLGLLFRNTRQHGISHSFDRKPVHCIPFDRPTDRLTFLPLSSFFRYNSPSCPLCLSVYLPLFLHFSIPSFLPSFPSPFLPRFFPSLSSFVRIPTCITNSLSRNSAHHLSATHTSLCRCLISPSDTPLLSRSPSLSHNHSLIHADCIHKKAMNFINVSVSASTLSLEVLSTDSSSSTSFLLPAASDSSSVEDWGRRFFPHLHGFNLFSSSLTSSSYFLLFRIFLVHVQFQYSIKIFNCHTLPLLLHL